MKSIVYLLVFQVLGCFAYSQNSDSVQKDEIQKAIEQQLFPGSKPDKNVHYRFLNGFEELFVETPDGYKLHGLLFKAINSKGLIFYLHGSNGAVDTWSKIAPTYTKLGYDIFLPDYRGYGKSEGKVTSENQLYRDVQTAYDRLKLNYSESNIILIGQSIGAAPAAMLAAYNNPQKLILQAPYYSLPDWINNVAPGLDTSNMKFQLKTYEFLRQAKVPVIIFHGGEDKAIYLGSSQKLSAFFKPGDQLVILKGEGHNDFTNNKDYLEKLKTILK